MSGRRGIPRDEEAKKTETVETGSFERISDRKRNKWQPKKSETTLGIRKAIVNVRTRKERMRVGQMVTRRY